MDVRPHLVFDRIGTEPELRHGGVAMKKIVAYLVLGSRRQQCKRHREFATLATLGQLPFCRGCIKLRRLRILGSSE